MEQIIARIRESGSLIVSAHVSPDADAVGSAAALGRILTALGKAVVIYLADDVPSHLRALLGDAPIVHTVPEVEFDTLIVVDTATRARIGKDAELLFSRCRFSIVIDHHISNSKYGDLNYIEGDAPSSASIVFDLAKRLGAPLDSDTLNLLYAGLCDDTGSFRYSNATPRAFSDAQELVELGAEVSRIAEMLFFSVPLNRVRLRARALGQLEFVSKDRVAFTMLSLADFRACGASPLDSEGVIDDIRAVQGVLGAVFMRETAEGYRFSLRSKSDAFDANAIAARFEGGGHRAAAGCTIRGVSAEEAKQRMVAVLDESL